MKTFKPNNYYKINSVCNPATVYVCSRTPKFVTILYNHKIYTLKVRHGFFNDSEHLNIPTKYKDVTLFCVATNGVKTA